MSPAKQPQTLEALGQPATAVVTFLTNLASGVEATLAAPE
jgi:hypothetical protein